MPTTAFGTVRMPSSTRGLRIGEARKGVREQPRRRTVASLPCSRRLRHGRANPKLDLLGKIARALGAHRRELLDE
jgi:hypothetical protein